MENDRSRSSISIMSWGDSGRTAEVARTVPTGKSNHLSKYICTINGRVEGRTKDAERE